MIIKNYSKIAIFISFLIFICSSCNKQDTNNELRTYKAEKKNMEILITEIGEIGSEIENSILAPFSSKINKLIDEGTMVKKGDLIAELATATETEEKEKTLLSIKEAEYDLKITNLRLKNEGYKLIKDLENSRLDLEISKNNLKKLLEERDEIEIVTNEETIKTLNKELKIYELDVIEREKLFKSGYLSEEELKQTKTKIGELKEEKEYIQTKLALLKKGPTKEEINKEKLNVQKSKDNLDKLIKENDIFNKTSKLELRQNEISIEKSQESFDYYDDLVKMGTLTSTGSGILIYGKMDVGNEEIKVKAGDAVKEGVTIAKIFDLNKPVIRMLVNEVDISKLYLNQSVRFYLDSYPNKQFLGLISNVSPIAVKKYEWDKNDVVVFEVTIKILDKDSVIRPGMTANVEVVVQKFENVMSIPSEAIFTEENKKYCYIKSGESIIKKEVEIGNSNEMETIIKKGINLGDLIILNPFEVKNI